ncbi:hypothetical protein ONZ43_g2527 [Nemania bipapillata]|uniref:Uncharacterized protein n=1 Tax=Nemania bipapillata TaxID=110536 RepID=A0ACC2J090_9PEZI|nr:hypothetical protein ONZ43_g2527 [Nemania bipapillata]
MIHNGKECNATLLVFDIRFQSRLQKHRYKSATIKVQFSDREKDARYDPVVVGLAPKGRYSLNKTSYEETTTFGGSVGATAGAGIANSEASIHWDLERTKVAKFKTTLTGRSFISDGRYSNEHNSVEWAMDENGDEQDGIPAFLQTAVLLSHRGSRPFQATLSVKSKVNDLAKARRVLSVGSDEDKIIEPVTIPGHGMNNNSVTGVRPEDLNRMETLPISNYFKINISEALPNSTHMQAALADPADPADYDPTTNSSNPAALPADGHIERPRQEMLVAAAEAVTAAATSAMAAAKAAEKAAEAALEAAKAALILAKAAGNIT